MNEIQAGSDIADKTCPYCQTRIGLGSSAVICSCCGMPHHSECWKHNNGCTTFGCSFAPGASAHVANGAHGTCGGGELEIVFHYSDGRSVRDVQPAEVYREAPPQPQFQPQYTEHYVDAPAQPTRANPWVWSVIGIFVFVVLVCAALSLSAGSKGVKYLKRGDELRLQGSIAGAQASYNLAIKNDPNLVAAYYWYGLLLLGLGNNTSDDKFSELIDSATRGETYELDQADSCFKVCIEKTSRLNDDDTVDYTQQTKSEIAGESYMSLGLTATLRVLANEKAGQQEYARQWISIAHSNIDNARTVGHSSRIERQAAILESVLSEYAY